MPEEVVEKVETMKDIEEKPMSVLLFLVDGISHLAARRYLKKTYYYLLNEQKGLPLNGFHTVGLNTFPNMVPYLTGKSTSHCYKT